jgi:hypothetical protein
VNSSTGVPIPNMPPITVSPWFQPTLRPWYIRVKETQRLAWQDVYVYASGDLGITAGAPVYRTNATTGDMQFAGVLAVDATIQFLNTFLSTLTVSKQGKCFIT